MEEQNLVYQKLYDLMKKIQPNANKKEKKLTFDKLKFFVNDENFTEDCYNLLFKGDEDKKLLGILELIGKKNSGDNFKESSKSLLKVLYELLYKSKKAEAIAKQFVYFVEEIPLMNLGEHYFYSKKNPEMNSMVLSVIKVVKEKHGHFAMEKYIRRTYIDEINKAIETVLKPSAAAIENFKRVQDLVLGTGGLIDFEPKTWDDVVKKKNKKLLTTEFLNYTAAHNNTGDNKVTFIDEDKELEEELIRNFIDPLTKNNSKLNVKDYTDEELRKLHLQFEMFDPVFFLEKFYSNISIEEFKEKLMNIENNLTQVNLFDENLIDRNIYKYLDCKKLLDFIISKFQNETNFNVKNFKENLFGLQNQISRSFVPVKKSFDLILKSKTSKEIIIKFAKYFAMKDKIEHYLKFSNFEELADYLKKINLEIKEISQTRFIYGDFFNYFSKSIEHFKSVLINIIENSSTNSLIIKHFRYLLEFDVEPDTVDLLLNNLKAKMCEKIKTNLEFTDNFEIKNFKEFFNDEFEVEIMNDEFFADTIKNADNYIHQVMNEKYMVEDTNNTENHSSKNMILSSSIKKQDSALNAENIILALFLEVKDFLFMMKVLEENINLKLANQVSSKSISFLTIVKEIYFTLFAKLDEFLFMSDFNILEIFNLNFTEKINSDKDLFKLIRDDGFENKTGSYNSGDDIANNNSSDKEELIKIYESNIEKLSNLFNDNFNKNTLQNLSNLIFDIFDLFEVYLDQDTLESLHMSKSSIIEKIFMSFLNEKIISSLNFFNEENTINFLDTNLSLFNESSFTFSKNFLKLAFKSFKSIIDFYFTILNKKKLNSSGAGNYNNNGSENVDRANNAAVNIDFDLIFKSFVFVLKCFLIRFVHFYKTEALYSTQGDFKRLNLLILEILKNYNYLKEEIKLILKALFKIKIEKYKDELKNLEAFLENLKQIFVDLYIVNAGENLFILSRIEKGMYKSGGNGNTTTGGNTIYEKYNDYLIDDKTVLLFADIRSFSIEIILDLAEVIKEFSEIKVERSINLIIINILNVYFSKVNGYLSLEKETIKNHLNNNNINNNNNISINSNSIGFNNDVININSKLNKKSISQIYLELVFLENILQFYITKDQRARENITNIKIQLLELISYNSNNSPNSNKEKFLTSEIDTFSREELERKETIINNYKKKYLSYLKCFESNNMSGTTTSFKSNKSNIINNNNDNNNNNNNFNKSINKTKTIISMNDNDNKSIDNTNNNNNNEVNNNNKEYSSNEDDHKTINESKTKAVINDLDEYL